MFAALALLAQVLGLFNYVLCDDLVYKILNIDDFINFTNTVNSGKEFRYATVFLENDLDFSEYQGELSPVGKDYSHSFYGSFDGQGFAIDHFIVNTTSSYSGLFGYSGGATIKNLIIGKNSAINLFGDETNNDLYGGSIFGYCAFMGGYCVIESCANLASVTFEGKTYVNVYLGGIAGHIKNVYVSYIKNTVNYGTVSSRGESSSATIGGIIGYYSGIAKSILAVNNSLNMGTIVFLNKTTKKCYIGGIVGNSEYCTYDNCVSGGKIIADKARSSTIGSLCGESSDTTFKNCYWSGDAGNLSLGTRTDECASYDSNSLVLDKSVTAGKHTGNSLLEVLNAASDYYFLYEYSHWGYSTGKYDITFKLNSRGMSLGLESQLFLLPSLSSDGLLWFDGWYADEKCTEPLTGFVFKGDGKVFGKWGENTNTYTVSFDTRGGYSELSPVMSQFSTAVRLPNNITKDCCEFKWWENDYGDNVGWYFTTPAHNVTLHAVWSCTKIRTASDLIGIAKVANSGSSYRSVTLSLESDIEFTDEESNQFESIGKDENVGFEGTFDGKGYTIRNLKIKTTFSRYGGLFGYSKGMTIRNLVLDPSCTVTSSYGSGSTADEESFFGSFIGYCKAINSKCNIENSVNMASVTFNGNSGYGTYIGGFTGLLGSSQDYGTNIINCVNYGTVKHSGKVGTFSYIGGLVGGGFSMNKDVFIINSMNYGAIHLNGDGEPKISYIGGIVGYSVDETNIENCVNIGGIITNNEGSCIGTIIGYMSSSSTTMYCYWSNNTLYNSTGTHSSTRIIGNSSSFNPETFELTDTISVGNYTGKSLIKSLNSYAKLNSDGIYSGWVINVDNNVVTFIVNNRTAPFLTLDSQVIIIPNFTSSESNVFSGWFSDSRYMNPVELSEITENITLYGLYGVKITVTFDPNSGLLKETAKYVILGGIYGYLPTSSMTGYSFAGWFTDNNESVTNETTVTISRDHTLHAQWSINSYAVTFDLGNGIVIIMWFNYNETIKYPDNPRRDGYKFAGWKINDIIMPAHNLTVTALWTEDASHAKYVILGIVVPLFITIIIITIIVLIIVLRKRRGSTKKKSELDRPLIDRFNAFDTRCRFIIVPDDKVDSTIISDSIKNTFPNLYPDGYTRPTMEDALLTAEFTEDHVELICNTCNNVARNVMKKGRLFDGFTKEDAAAIAMYTYDFGVNFFESNPYRIINKALMERDLEMLNKTKELLYLVMTALRKLPRVTGGKLYRGMESKIDPNSDYYRKDSIVTWSALSSTSPDMEATKTFLAKGSKGKKVEGTLFIIEGGWGYDIQPYSLFPTEKEILLEPERQFRVISVIDTDLTVVMLRMLDTPILLPEIFGKGRK